MSTLGEVFGSNGRERPNPFKRDAEGRIVSVSAISAAIRENPTRAIQLCKAAGENLDAWFPMNPR
ncbi:hypothetical protein [Mesorhizobium sp. M0847]|uniref:hypothetical protein n=1 Tax=unclassified Mesorhizobium TaxID=325217 RepID=UPI0033366A4D